MSKRHWLERLECPINGAGRSFGLSHAGVALQLDWRDVTFPDNCLSLPAARQHGGADLHFERVLAWRKRRGEPPFDTGDHACYYALIRFAYLHDGTGHRRARGVADSLGSRMRWREAHRAAHAGRHDVGWRNDAGQQQDFHQGDLVHGSLHPLTMPACILHPHRTAIRAGCPYCVELCSRQEAHLSRVAPCRRADPCGLAGPTRRRITTRMFSVLSRTMIPKWRRTRIFEVGHSAWARMLRRGDREQDDTDRCAICADAAPIRWWRRRKIIGRLLRRRRGATLGMRRAVTSRESHAAYCEQAQEQCARKHSCSVHHEGPRMTIAKHPCARRCPRHDFPSLSYRRVAILRENANSFPWISSSEKPADRALIMITTSPFLTINVFPIGFSTG